MITRSKVFEINKVITVLNWVKSKEWDNESIKKAIQRSLDNYKEGLEADITVTELKNRFKNYILKCITDKEYLKQELDEDRKSIIAPKLKNIKDYFKFHELPFETVEEYQSYLKNYILTEL